jgi:RAD51-like protein 2
VGEPSVIGGELVCLIDGRLQVVLTNQMTTRITPGEESRLVPALGTSWGYACAVRLNLFWKNDTRVAHLFKSPSKGEISASFIVVVSNSGSPFFAIRL